MEDYKKTPLWDKHLSIEERLDYLISELTLEEKISCLGTGCPEIPRLGIKSSFMGGEAAHGIEARHDQAFNAGDTEETTSFTQPIGMSASFDRDLIRECGNAVGEEARALFTRNGGGGLCRWAPTIDMERDPRWGRFEEAYGEDPYLTGEMSSAYIQGMKGEHPFYIKCGATLKHFYANNVEKDRIRISSSVDERNKYEYYLEPFRKAVEEGGAEAIMTSYNEINGVPAIVNHEVQDIIKDTFGLPGHVVCDGGDFQQTVNDHHYFTSHAQTLAFGLKAGVDCFTDDRQVVCTAAREALDQGLITEKEIDRSVRNSFRTRIRLGFFDGEGDCPYTGMGEEFINTPEHQRICRQMAGESVVLLKNENHFLPLDASQTSSLAVVGPLSDIWYLDWYCGIPPYYVTVLGGIQKAMPDTEIYAHSGLSKIRLKCNDSYVGLDQDNRLFLTDIKYAETFTITDWGCGSATLRAESNHLFVTLEEGSYLIKAEREKAFSWFIRESWEFVGVGKNNSEDMKGSYYLNSWNGRRVTVDENGYLAVIKTNEVVPGEGDDAKLNRKSYAIYQGDPAIFQMEIVSDGIAEAVKAARKAQKAVVVLGCNPVINSKEEIDRTTLALPPYQQKLADAVLLANPNTVVVLVSNYPYAIGELQEKIPAILYSVSGSQELGNGIADILTGKMIPAGRLPMTWYRSDCDLPDMNDYDIIQKERTYQYFQNEVLYPFGYGLSYTTFFYGEVKVDGTEGEVITLKIPVTNTGKVKGDEVVQLYVRKIGSRVKRPRLQLKGFVRLKELVPGETKEAVFTVHKKDLRYYDVISRSMILEEGEYLFMAGASSEDIRQKVKIALKGSKAPLRNPFAVTLAIQYDESRNCFVHRGTKGHTINGSTCMIPGKAGEDPDKILSEMGEQAACDLFYRDFMIDQIPGQIRLRICAVEDGEIILTFTKQKEALSGTTCRIAVNKNEDLEFTDIHAELPVGFSAGMGKYNLQISLLGKIKISEYQFSV